MAPKPKARSKAPAKPVQKAAPKGLQLSAAQWKAYNAAYNAAASAGFKTLALQQRRQAFQTAVNTLVSSRLQAANKLAKITAAQHTIARRAAIAAFAVGQTARQSRLSHQNNALQQRIFADYERHLQLASRAQYAYKGEKAFTHQAVLNTLTIAQATSAITASWARAEKAARKASASTSSQPSSAASQLATATILSNARNAGLNAAAKVPKPKAGTAPRTSRTARKPASLPAPKRLYGWRGNPVGKDCVAAAVANSLTWALAYHVDDPLYLSISQVCGRAPSLYHATLRLMYRLDAPVHLESFKLVDPDNVRPGCVVGFRTTEGRPHAALLLAGGTVATWGEQVQLEEVAGGNIDEAYELTWVRRVG